MPKNELDDYSGTAGSNTDVGGVNIAENCSPANINNAIREVMSDIAHVIAGTTTVANWYTVALNVSGTATIGTLSVTTMSPTTLSVSANATIGGTLGVTGAITGSSTLVATAITGDRFIPAASTVPANGMYLPAANTPAFASNSGERLRFNSSGAWGIGGANYGTSGQVIVSGGSGAAPAWGTPSSYNPSADVTAPGYGITWAANSGAANVRLQAGTATTGGSGSVAVVFDTAFTSAPYISATAVLTTANNNLANAEDVTTTGMTLWSYDTGGTEVVGQVIHWLAIGPVA